MSKLLAAPGARPEPIAIAFLLAAVVFLAFLSDASADAIPVSLGAPAISGAAWDIDKGDLDGDGDLDVVAAMTGPGYGLLWGENRGGTWFTRSISTGTEWRAVTTADIDGDGDLDVIAAGNSPLEVRAFLNINSGSSWSTNLLVSLGTVTDVPTLRVADLNGDGDLDLVVGTQTGGTGSLESYLQAGSLSNWANTTVWSTVVAPLDFALGDIDQDSDIDIVALDGNASGAGGIIRRYLNDGDGIGWMPSPLANSASVPSDVRLADMDDDGDLDAFVTIIGTNDLVWYENVFLGQWPLHTIGLAGTATRACEPVDMDGDGDLDVVGSSLLIGQFRWWENTDGVGDTWTQRVPLTSGVFAPQEMLTGDFDNDGDIDTVGITAANVAFFVNDRIHTTSTPDPADLAVSLSGPQDAFPIDIDRDGLLDLVTGSRGDDRVQWLRNVDGNGTWTIETVDTAFDGASVVGADIDRQGGIDIVGGSIDTGEVAWWANWATGFAKTTIATLPGLQQIAVGDLDGDSDIDVVVVGTGLLRWYENVNGDGSLWRITDLDIDALSGASSVAIGDLDGDGTMDIVHGSTGAPGVRVHAGLLGLVATGYGIQQPSLGALPVVTLADVNRDGELDMLVASGNDVLWLENDGGGVSFTARTVASGSTPAVRITTGDIDADGDIDVVTTHGGADDVVRWWSNDGAAMSWTERPLPGLVDDPVGVGIGDFDNDGGIDVAATASTGGSVYVWTSTRGQFSLDGSDVAPSTWVNGQMDAVLRIDANHLGRMPDGDAELTSLELAFDTPAFVPLTDSQLAAKVASVRVFHDADLSGDFDAALDDQVAFDGAPALSAGLLNVPLSPMVPFTYGAPETFFVVVELTATADQTPNIAVSHAPYAGDGSTARHEGVFFSDLSLGGSDTVTAIVGVSTDADGDGYFTGVDCDDADPAVNPGAVEVCDGIDNDCDALVDEAADTDGDGSDDCQDCAVMDPSTFPGATELCDGLDNDCDGAVPGDEQDFDGDGVSVCDGDCDDIDAGNVPGGIEICDGSDNDCDGALLANEVDADFDFFLACGGDCDDTDPNINPFAFEVCDGLDTNCDPLNDAPGEVDLDFDGVMDCLGDCDDGDSTIYPGALEICDGLDNDCDGSPGPLEVDADADAFLACGGDCDDAVATVFPGATELCDGLDNDCDGVVPAAELDGDGDGVSVCAGDCDDVVAAVFPGATEVCDGLDNDCDGVVPAAEVDGDGDGVTACAGDCDDAVASVFPGASELCDGLDNDCDGVVPANEADGDNDGVSICDGDCDDADFFNWPGNVELCDGDDNDCDGVVPADEIDGDGDGFLLCLDCDDTNPSVNGEAQELCDGLDTNCDGVIPANEGDQDGDGESGCLDCNDNDVTVYTGAPELCDGLDNDCDGVLSAAETGDGDGDLVPTCVDCDDADPTVYPGATEICNGIDDDCDGALPLFDVDSDGDGLAICQGDCNDADAAINPSATEVCNGVDDDCDGALPFAEQDLDGDGLSSCAGDCLDQGPGGLEATASPTIYPGAPELCDGYDNDCDGVVGNGTLEWDSDLDGQRICQGDCDDNDATVYAGATEICNGIDDDCDGALPLFDIDSDGDGLAICQGDCNDADATINPSATEVCNGVDDDCDGALPFAEQDLDGDGLSSCAGDCLDQGPGGLEATASPTVYPGAPELCDGYDNDCDGVVGNGILEWDSDLDGQRICQGDCDDNDATVYAGATEICNGIDDDCDGALPLFDIDSDGDGLAICQGDCNDADAAINPSATEVCNGVDDDCDGALPFAEQDLDGDGLSSCAGDCLDQGPGGLEATASPTVYPGAPELCDGYDNDCDGVVGNGILEWDSDLDGQRICQGDCDDNDATVYAGATEICNGIDDDCDGVTDNGGSTTDSDGDGVTTCAGDCDDNDAAVYPGATEVCDGTDNDCDGELELADVCVDSCGDGVVDNTPYFVPSCPNPGVVTQIGDRSELLAWAADPSTSANLRAAIDFSGFGLEVVTDCSLTSSAGADLSNADDVFIAAGSLDLAGSIEASGNVVLWGDTSADLRSSGTILGAEVAIEIPDLILRADVNSFGFCSEAVSFSHRGRSRVDLLGGDGIVYADDIDLRGDYQDIGNLTFIADVIDQRSNSSIDAAGDVLVDGGAVVDLEGVIAVGGILDVFANYVRLDTASAHTAVGSANYTSLGFSLMDLRGSVSSGGDVTIDAAGIYLRSSALIESNADVELTANGLFLGYGDIVQNGDVTIDSAVYYLGNGHDLSGNTSCTIGGFALWWGQSPNGCTAVP